MKWPLKNKNPNISEIGSVGDFASRRSFYFHPGIDIYCDEAQEVQVIEDGVIVHIENFTGPEADPPSPWWNETWSILIEGQSGVIGYCELRPLAYVKVGLKVKEGDVIAKIIPVLKKDKGNGRNMIHIELYKLNTRHHVTWLLDTAKPDELENPRQLLEKIINN